MTSMYVARVNINNKNNGSHEYHTYFIPMYVHMHL